MHIGRALVVLGLAASTASAQTAITPPPTSYSLSEERELGREAATALRRILPVLKDRRIERFVGDIGRRLVGHLPSPFQALRFRYSFELLNLKDIASYGLPGGSIFLSRGIIEAARSDGQVAALMAHQLSHVVLRHGTAQATRGEHFEPSDIDAVMLGAVVGGSVEESGLPDADFAISPYFLQFNAEHERQADLLGLQIMARAGYDPREMAAMFRTIASEGNGRGLPEWLNNHPDPGDGNQGRSRDAYIAREADTLAVVKPNAASSGLDAVHVRLQALAPAASAEDVARARATRLLADVRRPVIEVLVPDGRSRRVAVGNVLRMEVPANWRRTSGGSTVIFAPAGASFESSGATTFTHGMQVGIARSPTGTLEGDTRALLRSFAQKNPRLRWTPAFQTIELRGRDGLTTALTNVSAITQRFQYVSVSTAHLRDGNLLYIIGIAPQNELGTYRGAFTRVRQSIEFAD